jgi:formamidopyrimidine-DNA glycosylase
MVDDEKDRLGEKLRQKEKAEEDRFFAERDKQLLKKLHDARADPCPKCGSPLKAVEHGGKTTLECPTCRPSAR